MKVWNEAAVRALHKETAGSELSLPPDAFLTRAARAYLENQKSSPQRTGKPEHMTHLHGTALVPKSHPRIRLRGKLDSFQGKLLEAQLCASESGEQELNEQLSQVLDYCRRILIAEVTEQPLGCPGLLGMDEQELRYVSQHPKEQFGVDHMAPTADMGELCVMLNSLRAESREVELAGVDAFCYETQTKEGGREYTVEREDLLQALNRLSSGLYILYCRQLAKKLEVGRMQR